MRVKYWQLLSSLISPTLSSFFPGGTAHVVQLANASLVCNYITQIYGAILMYSVMVGIILHGCVQVHHSDSSNIIKGRIHVLGILEGYCFMAPLPLLCGMLTALTPPPSYRPITLTVAKCWEPEPIVPNFEPRCEYTKHLLHIIIKTSNITKCFV